MIPPPPPELHDVPEPELLRRFRQGGRAGDEAYSELIRRYQASIVRLVGYLLGDASEAEDVAQEAFVKGFTARESFDRGDNFSGWLRTIATRVAYNCRRESKTRKKYHDASASIGEGFTTLDDGEVRGVISDVLGRMGYAYREILVLRYVEELSVTEIGEVLNLGESATKMRLLRAREEFWNLQREPTA
jgi:RNA polymerase sigma-70 factor (ECF subfamily)